MRSLISLLAISVAGSAFAEERTLLRVLTYNIHHGAGIDGKLDLKRIASVITKSKADIVALQEVDRNTSRTDKVDQAAELARLTKSNVLFGPNIKFGGGDYGNAVLSRFPIRLRKNHPLPNPDNGEQRGVLDVEITTKAGPVRLLATHFDHRKPEKSRLVSVAMVNRLLSKEPTTPTLLAGDLNAVRNSQPLAKLAAMWQQPKQRFLTVPVGKPTRQIDYVLASKGGGLKILETSVLLEAVASDHRPLLSVVEVRTGKTADPRPVSNGSQK